MEKAGIFIFIVILIGVAAGAFGFLAGDLGPDPGTRPEYADSNGDGFVPANGDPLWDQHYAEQVNGPNSLAKENLGQAEEYQAAAELQRAEAGKVRAGTLLTNLLVGAVVFIFLFVAGVITLGIVLR